VVTQTQIGLNVQLFVEKVNKAEQGLALTLLRQMVVPIVLEKRIRLNLAHSMNVQVRVLFHIGFIVSNQEVLLV